MANEILMTATKEVLGMSPNEVVVAAVVIGLFLFAYGFIGAQLKDRKRRDLSDSLFE